ncbi:CRISPR-associated protein Cas5 [Actinomadura rubteroloni]|uniref:pre-crRNA processing endonuclease n=1 Tax=Actinomadura rubteroloni TaxID=1926885 RepID=A0A2P4URW2_9ACTN|nr:type I-C CRISPR-associated protein Cas5c [Actinomadura rubteroloni]POM27785.1 CRISPR-associated protein Cas5 [Actinomadura rubteroloni]
MTTAGHRGGHHPPPALVVEVGGPLACFTRPEYKSERLSYPVMTPSAARGVLEAIFWKPEFEYQITQIDVLSKIKWAAIRRNEVESMLTVDWVRKAMADTSVRYDVEDDRDQRNMVCLRDVDYRIHAQVRLRTHATEPIDKYRAMFRRRMDRGACFSQPFLGTREFSASYVRKLTDRPPIPHTEDLGVMLHSIEYGERGETYTWFLAELKDGVMHVPKEGRRLSSAEPASTRRDA